ncbi:MAG: hypothetical protein ACFCUQ_22320 [Kiloniellales bacterium]
MALDEMSETELQAFLETALRILGVRCLDGPLIHVCMDWRHVELLPSAGGKAFGQLKNICV